MSLVTDAWGARFEPSDRLLLAAFGYLRIAGELRKLGVTVSASSVRDILIEAGLPPGPRRDAQSWRRFLRA